MSNSTVFGPDGLLSNVNFKPGADVYADGLYSRRTALQPHEEPTVEEMAEEDEIIEETLYQASVNKIADDIVQSNRSVGIDLVVQQTLDPSEAKQMYLRNVFARAYKYPIIIRSSLAHDSRSKELEMPRNIEQLSDHETFELHTVFGGVHIDNMYIDFFAIDSLRILCPNVTINNLRITNPVIHPDISYDQQSGHHMDMILQSYGERVMMEGSTPFIITPNNVRINNLVVECDEQYMAPDAYEQLLNRDVRASGIMMSSNLHYRNWHIGTQGLRVALPSNQYVPTWINSQHLSDSVIGSSNNLPFFTSDAPMLIRSSKGDLRKSANNMFLNMPSTMHINYNGNYMALNKLTGARTSSQLA